MYEIMQIDFNFFVQENMFILKQIHVHWVNLMKKIITKFESKGKDSFLYQFANCLYSLN